MKRATIFLRFALALPLLAVFFEGSTRAAEEPSNLDFETPPQADPALTQAVTDGGWTLRGGLPVPGWRIHPNFPGQYELFEGDKSAHSGQGAIYVQGKLLNNSLIPFSDEKTLEISFWAKSEGGNSDVSGTVYIYHQNAFEDVKFLSEVSEKETAGTRWEQHKFSLTLPSADQDGGEGSPNTLIFAIESELGAVFDDVKVSLKK